MVVVKRRARGMPTGPCHPRTPQVAVALGLNAYRSSIGTRVMAERCAMSLAISVTLQFLGKEKT